ncbi:MAG: TonB-dependent receptor [Saprospiraceae bacterium]|nr:TonB-dependent receptor [Saprospiraceae bacterium]
MIKPFLLGLIGFILNTELALGQISGIVFDETKAALPGANILLLPDSLLAASEIDGRFSFDNLPDGDYELLVTYIGFEPSTLTVIVKNGRSRQLEIKLQLSNNILGTVEVTDEHAKQEETLHTEHVHEDFFQKNLQGAFAKSLEKLPGISAISVGAGIAKPVIRGLSANRIIVNHQGIKQESQQWGSDHGLEIDQFDVERVEIIKGPGSLQYGSDGLGGVINIMPGKLLPKNSFDGSVLGVHKTNNDHWGGSARLAFNLNNWFLTARYSRQDFADYRVPGNLFVYNGFELPIVNERLKNTAGDEENLSISAGVSRNWGITRLLFSHYSLDAGLFSGAVGIPRSYALTNDGNSRDIDVPRQSVDHYRASLNQTFFFGKDHLAFDVGYQRNLRREFSEPEFHSIPLSQLADPNDKLGIELELQTFSIASHYEHRFRSDWKNNYGGNLQWQHNQRGGFEYLLPEFRTFRGGLFTITERELRSNWLVNGGLRFDLGQNGTEFYRQFVWDSNENITDSLLSPATDDLFLNWSASLGSNLTLDDGKWVLKANFGKSFRVPYPAETVSNGIHHGTFRHEVGTPGLKSEHGYQFDLSADWSFEKFTGGLALYFNYFDNYIYLGPTFPARFSPLPEAGQIFRYRQDDAIYTGFELQWTWAFLPRFSFEQAVDFVQSYNPKTKLALPFTPQPAIRTDLRFSLAEKKWLRDFYVELGHQYHFAASGRLRVDRSERTTPAYQLWGLGLGTDLVLGGQSLQISCQVQNVFDTTYFAHLSRYRLINVPEQGRNLVMTVKVPFGGKL